MESFKAKGVKLISPNPLYFLGWGTWIRTTIHGVRVRCPAIERSPNSMKGLHLHKIPWIVNREISVKPIVSHRSSLSDKRAHGRGETVPFSAQRSPVYRCPAMGTIRR